MLTLLLLGTPGAVAAPLEGPCDAAIRDAEVEQGIPTGLLAAVALVESGTQLTPDGPPRPWPWTIDVAGQDRRYASGAAAVADVAALRAGGVASIDVGCLQVNLAYHPDAFASLTEAFDPVANARYAARFLASLAVEFGDWSHAVGAYHSRVAALADPYRARVFAIWGTAPLPRPPAGPVVPVVPVVVPIVVPATVPGAVPVWLSAARAASPATLPAPALRWRVGDACAWSVAGGCAASPFASVATLRLALAQSAGAAGR